MFRLLDEIIEDKNIAGVEAAAQGIFGVSAKNLSVPQAAFILALPQSPIVYSPYAADGSLKEQGEPRVRSGACQRRFVQYVPGRGTLSKKTTRPMLSTT